MAWTYTPDTGTTGSGGAPWTTGYSVALSDFVAAENDIHTWGGDVNAGTHKLTNCTGISCASGANLNLGAGLQIQTTGVDCHIYLSDSAPSICLGNNATRGSATFKSEFVMATAAGNYGFPSAGEAGLIATNHIHVNPRYFGGTGNVILDNTPTYASDSAAGTAGLTAGMVWADSSGNLHRKL
jgi:hypothetical protein